MKHTKFNFEKAWAEFSSLDARINRAKNNIRDAWKKVVSGELPEETLHDRINHFLWLKAHKK